MAENKEEVEFGAFLKKTRKELNLSKKELSKSMAKNIPEFGIEVKERRGRKNKENAAGYSYYESMEAAPKFEIIIRLAMAFGVPVDYMLNYKKYEFLDANEVKDYPLGLLPEKYAAFHFGRKLREIRKSQNLSMDKFEKMSGMRKPSLQQYEKYKDAPKEQIIDFFVANLGLKDATAFYPEMESLEKKLKHSTRRKTPKTSANNAGISINFESEGNNHQDDVSVLTITLPAGMNREKAIEEAVRRLQELKKK